MFNKKLLAFYWLMFSYLTVGTFTASATSWQSAGVAFRISTSNPATTELRMHVMSLSVVKTFIVWNILYLTPDISCPLSEGSYYCFTIDIWPKHPTRIRHKVVLRFSSDLCLPFWLECFPVTIPWLYAVTFIGSSVHILIYAKPQTFRRIYAHSVSDGSRCLESSSLLMLLCRSRFVNTPSW